MIELLWRLIGHGKHLANGEEDEEDYTAIINSSKYADSNSNTEQIEKLLAAININKRQVKEGDDKGDHGVGGDSDNKDTVNKPNGQDSHGQEEETTKSAAAEKQRVSIASIICRESEEVLPGQPVYVPAKFGKEGGQNFNLRKFDIPRWIYDTIQSNDVDRLRLTSPLNMDNYTQRFQTLLWVEEAQQAIEMRKYDMYDVLLAKHEDFFLLEVPGLAEGRPSLLRGDRLILRSEKRSSCYEGFIHDVREKDILFKLHEYLHSTEMDGLRFVVQFISSRTPFRRCHHGVCQYKERTNLREIIFPVMKADQHYEQRPSLVNFDDQQTSDEAEDEEEKFPCFMSCLNNYQKRAVINILKGQSRPAPYIIFGPPGTGKTVTMVEAILQVYARTKHFKILVCANSNSSADLCAKRIKDSKVVPSGELIRVSAFYRMEKLVPPELQDITREMDMIDAHTYQGYRIVVTTCIQAGSLYEFKDRFDYVFIDEAGHACEPEALIPIGLLQPGGSCVLAGDPHQLGPVCMSRVADQYGLGTSLLDRLCRRSLYERRFLDSRTNKMDYNGRFITKLRICYRCDPRVLAINNKMFYDGDLKFRNETPEKWMQLLKVDKPLIFHSVKGRDRREKTNPSWFNPAEAIRCLTYVKRLYDSGLRAEQLGIISPYRRQIEKLQLLFESCNLEKCKIATIEEFQGDEREVIIITTVRTRERKLDFDRKFQLGFLFNPKRFNVAISRAKWLVIVVGDPQILERDTYWTQYMEQAFKFE